MQSFRLLNIDRKEWVQLGSLADIAASDPGLIPLLLANSCREDDYLGRWAGDKIYLVGSLKLWGSPHYDTPDDDWTDITQDACAAAAKAISLPEESGGHSWSYAPEYG